MRFALANGAPTAPYWVAIMDAASDWGVTPWSIAGDGREALWWLRYEALRTERIRVQKSAQNKQGRAKAGKRG